VTGEITPIWTRPPSGWRFESLLAALRPDRGGATAWDRGPRRARFTGWLLYDAPYDLPEGSRHRVSPAGRSIRSRASRCGTNGSRDSWSSPVSFLNPLFLFGLAAAAIPIIIHLFTRRRPREVPFPRSSSSPR
jgi:hypothetical protein